MTTRSTVCAAMMSASFAVLFSAVPVSSANAQGAATANLAKIGAEDIGGVVTSATGPEAGVWVIAETKDLPTRYVKIVVTDDLGRFVIPGLPRANYDVWVRGYGLVDSPKTKIQPGKTIELKSIAAPSRAAAAQYYPAQYWYSMLKVPAAKLFPGTGPSGNGMSQQMQDQGMWLRNLKTDGCNSCHQLGDVATRTIPPALGHFNTGAEAWERRLQSGQASSNMMAAVGRFDTQRALTLFADWTDRVAKGELPRSDPPRPAGIERNVVVTEWDWNTPQTYVHDEIATDRRNPGVNAHGIIYGSTDWSSDSIPWLDPVDNKSGTLKTEWRDPKTPTTKTNPIYGGSAYWGTEPIWDSHTVVHNPMYDDNGRLWLTARIRPQADPAFCKPGSNNPYANIYPLTRSGRQAEVYDPKTHKIAMIDLCFSTHHLQFDKNNILWFSSGGGSDNDVIGWLDVGKWDTTHDAQASQGWAPFVLDTNANGKRDAGWVEPKGKIDPQKDMRIVAGIYSVSPNPADGSVWGTVLGFPGGIVRFDPKTQLSEYYEVPWKNQKTRDWGFSPRGADITSDGVVWTALASGDLASFDRRLCKGPLKGPALADPQNLCPEGWKIHHMPGPVFEGFKPGDPGAVAEAPYYDWVDQHNTSGLGANTPIATGNESDSLAALVNGKWIVLRVPYPLGYFAKGMDGRIDDAKAGWKGKGLWSAFSNLAPTHIEGGKGETSKVVHFQIRPNPLAS
ncbi:MAG TPA: carboxypeptidase-like regulatory domain-containing protein [Micropepsaceae bacterium]|nr:carboxypeptidase-like regulatory domain-containing protein [Micropepsaceae bacterium]